MAVAIKDDVSAASRRLLGELLGDLEGTGVAIRLWDGASWGDRKPRATLVLEHPGSLRRMLWPPNDLTLGEAFVFRDFDLEGDIEAVFGLAERLEVALASGRMRRARLAAALLALPEGELPAGAEGARPGNRRHAGRGRIHTKSRDRESVRYHYDVGNDFYSLWLDSRMQYSCAYFCDGVGDLEEAQRRKLEHICRKLRLRPGDRLLDVGCGWGGLAEHAAREHGAHVLGVTLSEPQAALANERLAGAGVAHRARVEVADYREVAGRFDKAVSVGMAEHVGRERQPEYFGAVFGVLEPGGVFLNHAISTAETGREPRGDGFLQRYVFPDGELLPVSETLSVAEAAGFEVRDVEGLREHYAMTLRHWVRRLEGRAEEIRSLVGDPTYRVWRLFMAGSAHAFHVGAIGVHQALLLKPAGGPSGLPLTREDWYR